MRPYLFSIAGINVATYGFFVAFGYIAGVIYLRRNVPLRIKPDEFWNLIFAILVGAILGGKIFYVATFWDGFGYTFMERIINVIKDFRYGFVFYGGFAGAATAGFIYARRISIPFWETADFAAPAIALGHAIGRLGCLAAGCCYGYPTTMPWAIVFNNPLCLVDKRYLGVGLHPTQLYESLGNFALFLLLHYYLMVSPHKNGIEAVGAKRGAVMLLYIAGYSVLRFMVEFYRGDDRGNPILWVSQAQFIAVLCIIACLVVYRFLPQNEKT